MQTMKPAKILFFVDGPAPSNADYEAAQAMKAQVVFRNARAVPSENHALEACDGVAGKVPALYAEAYPKAEEAIAKKADELKALSSKVGDSAPPKPIAPAADKPADRPKAPEGDKPAAPGPDPANSTKEVKQQDANAQAAGKPAAGTWAPNQPAT